MKRLPLYSILFSAYPVLFLYSFNIKETPISQMVLPLLLSIAGSLLLGGLIFLITKDLARSSMILTVIILFFFNYGRIYDLLKKLKLPFIEHKYFVLIFLFILGYAIYFVNSIKQQKTKENITGILNIVSAVLVLINVLNIGFYSFNHTSKSSGSSDSQNLTLSEKKINYKPDIYLIIPDEYGSVDTMKEVYNYDNSPFTSYLEGKGFYIAHGQSKYIGTSASIPSILNMEYLEDHPEDSSISKGRVQTYLESIGYKTTWFGIDPYYDSMWKIKADKYYNFYHKSGGINNFEKLFLDTTLVRPYYDYKQEKGFTNIYRTAINQTLSTFTDTASQPGPKIVIMHLQCPHQPFVFGANGEEVAYANKFNWNDKQYYRNQYIYITQRIKETVDNIMKKTKGNAIVLIQSDHGPRGGIIENDTVTNQKIVPEKYRHQVFQAYYLPKNGNSVLYKDMSPVNLFRVIFDYYFNTGLGKLKDYKY